MVILSKRTPGVNGAGCQVDVLAALDADLSGIESEAPSCNCDATCHCDDSDAKESTESAAASNVVDEILSSSVPGRGVAIDAENERYDIDDSGTGEEIEREDERDDEDEAAYRVVHVRDDGDIEILQGTFTYDQAQDCIKEMDRAVGVGWLATDLSSMDPRREALIDSLRDSARSGDYTRLHSVGLQLGLLRHLDQIAEAIYEGKVNAAYHVGIVAKSLERFTAQVLDGAPPEFAGSEPRWQSESFDNGMDGNITEDELSYKLNYWMDKALVRDWPQVAEKMEGGAA